MYAIADAMQDNLEMLAVAESWENGKPVRETLGADLPLAIDHFRYFAGAIRAEEGRISEIDKDTVAYHFNEPLGVVGQIVPFNFPIASAACCNTRRAAARSRSCPCAGLIALVLAVGMKTRNCLFFKDLQSIPEIRRSCFAIPRENRAKCGPAAQIIQVTMLLCGEEHMYARRLAIEFNGVVA